MFHAIQHHTALARPKEERSPFIAPRSRDVPDSSSHRALLRTPRKATGGVGGGTPPASPRVPFGNDVGNTQTQKRTEGENEKRKEKIGDVNLHKQFGSYARRNLKRSVAHISKLPHEVTDLQTKSFLGPVKVKRRKEVIGPTTGGHANESESFETHQTH